MWSVKKKRKKKELPHLHFILYLWQYGTDEWQWNLHIPLRETGYIIVSHCHIHISVSCRMSHRWRVHRLEYSPWELFFFPGTKILAKFRRWNFVVVHDSPLVFVWNSRWSQLRPADCAKIFTMVWPPLRNYAWQNWTVTNLSIYASISFLAFHFNGRLCFSRRTSHRPTTYQLPNTILLPSVTTFSWATYFCRFIVFHFPSYK